MLYYSLLFVFSKVVPHIILFILDACVSDDHMVVVVLFFNFNCLRNFWLFFSCFLLQGRVVGNVTQKDCTTLLHNFPSNYSDVYFFRLECVETLKYTFTDPVNILAYPGTNEVIKVSWIFSCLNCKLCVCVSVREHRHVSILFQATGWQKGAKVPSHAKPTPFLCVAEHK